MNKEVNFSTKEIKYLKERNSFVMNFVIENGEDPLDLPMNGFQLADLNLLNYYVEELKKNNEVYG